MNAALTTGWHSRATAVAIGLATATVIVFGRMVWDGHPFIHLDDWQYVVQNPMVRAGLSWDGLAWAFHPATFVANNWHPVTLVSHMIDASLFGVERPWGHHLTSLLLHTANVVLVFALLLRATGAFWASALVAALFAWHPTRVESVAWVAERKDVLSGTFALLTIAAYGAWIRQPGRGRYVRVVLLFALGLMSKSMLVTLPFALLLLDVWPLQRLPLHSLREGVRAAWPLVAEKLPLFALAIAITVMAFVSQGSTGAVADLERAPLLARIANAATSYWAYIGMLLWPTDLAVMYPIAEKRLTIEGTLVAALALGGVSLFAWRARLWPFLPVGWAWYVGTLVPVIGLVQLGSQAMADRYLYLPGLGLFVVAAFGLREVAERHPALRLPLAGGLSLSLVALAALTFVQTGHWRSTQALFRHNLEVAGSNDLVWNALAVAYDEAGEPDRALAAYERAILDNPDSGTAHLAIGSIRMRQESWAEAIASLERAVELGIGEHDLRAHLWLGDALRRHGDDAAAVDQYALVIERDPTHLRARLRHALALEGAGQGPEALAALDLAMRRHPRALEARVLASRLLAAPADPHDPERAVDLAKSVWADAPKPSARYATLLAEAYGSAGRRDDERKATRQALRLAQSDGDLQLVRKLKARLESEESGP